MSASASAWTIIRPSSPAASSSASPSRGSSRRIPRSSSPTSRPENLDEATGRAIVDLIFALKRERGATLVLVTHDLSLAALCERTVRLRSGVIEAEAEMAVA
ncbi:hypothetical protein BTHI11S_01700 [Bosea thiooxidans]